MAKTKKTAPVAKKVPMSKLGKKIWKTLKKNGVCLVTLDLGNKSIQAFNEVEGKLIGKGHSYVQQADKSFSRAVGAVAGIWMFVLEDKLPIVKNMKAKV